LKQATNIRLFLGPTSSLSFWLSFCFLVGLLKRIVSPVVVMHIIIIPKNVPSRSYGFSHLPICFFIIIRAISVAVIKCS
jgi:hypothetical protein